MISISSVDRTEPSWPVFHIEGDPRITEVRLWQGPYKYSIRRAAEFTMACVLPKYYREDRGSNFVVSHVRPGALDSALKNYWAVQEIFQQAAIPVEGNQCGWNISIFNPKDLDAALKALEWPDDVRTTLTGELQILQRRKAGLKIVQPAEVPTPGI